MKIDLWKLKTFIRGLRLHTLLYIRGCACSHQVSLRAGRWDSNNRYQTESIVLKLNRLGTLNTTVLSLGQSPIMTDTQKYQELRDVANKIRLHSIRSTQASNSGHPTSCASCAEILSVLFFDVMRYKVEEPRDPSSDRFVMSKGHACPALYGAWAEAGLFPASDLLNLRKISSDLEGHPTPRLNFIDVATGSLGQGLSCAAGMAWAAKNVEKANYLVYCLLGDGECAEGSVWEALNFSSFYQLNNLIAVFDINRLGQSDPTAYQHDLDSYSRRFEACGWQVVVVDGHDVEALSQALHGLRHPDKPKAIIAKTFKGRGFTGFENNMGFHGKPLGGKADDIISEIEARIVNKGLHNLKPAKPVCTVPEADISNIKLPEPPSYNKGDMVAMRDGYSQALVKLGKVNSRIIAMDGDMKNSTFSEKYQKAYPDRFVECFIAEQNMVGAAIGAATRDRAVLFISTFAAFFSRAYDQIRMGAVSQTNINFCGSHCGVSIGPDGPSQMALEDLAMFRALPSSTVFYPSDAVSMERAVELATNTRGICYIRMTRPATPILYDSNEEFSVGKAKIIRQSDNDQLTLVTGGITLHQACLAADELATSGINIRILDPFTIKPLDTEMLTNCAKATGGRILTVEDHYPEGGLGEAVSAAVGALKDVCVYRVAVESLPRSGLGDELLAMYDLDSAGIVKHAKAFLQK